VGCLWLARGEPYVPNRDDQVVERLPFARAMTRLRANCRRCARNGAATANDVGAATQLAAAYIDQAGAEGDPRYVGYAQAALQPWWRDSSPPVAVRT
jgi:hypothetical protein